MRTGWASTLALALLLAACARPPVRVEPPKPEEVTPPIEAPLPPTATRGKFTIEADKLDTWNAVGQIVVRTPGVEYQGRSQMLDLYSVRYRGVSFLILTKSLLLSDKIKRVTTEVTAATPKGGPIDEDAVAELLALLQQQLPAEIQDVRAKQAAEAKEKKASASKKKKKK